MHSSHPMIPRAGNESAVADSWERFVHNDPLENAPVRDVVLESWRRCRSEAVDPARDRAPAADDARIRALREKHRSLHEAACPVLDAMKEVLHESGSIIMLTDPSGTIIDLHGDTRARNAGEVVNLAQGGRWVENVMGTNAIGTAIAALKPVQIYASEHYCLDVKRWTCAAAPILDLTGTALLGVVDVSGVKETFHGHSLGLVMAAAKQIEAVLASRERDLHARLLEHSMDSFVRYGGDCVMVFDRRGRLLKSNGRQHLAREQYGVQLPSITGSQVDALDLDISPDERAVRMPLWLNGEWLQVVRTPSGELGTMLIIPLGHGAGVQAPSAAAREVREPASCPKADPFAEIIGVSEALVAAKARAQRLAPLDLPVMLLGETGVGKEVFARAIHKAGVKPDAPFVAVNCGALTRELLASELFGYVEGAFTGARRNGLPGKFELADGGILFLDEIGEMPLDMQPHLLRVLQDGVVVRLGDTRERRVSVRIIAATNRDLRGEVAAGRFREDLFHRLCVTSIRLPALRERPDDISRIVDHLNARLAQKYACPAKRITPDVVDALLHYAWPGNVRELQNVFEGLFALSDNGLIDRSVLPEELVSAGREASSPAALPAAGLNGARLEDLEQQAILSAVSNAKGNISQAARALGISRSTLYVKLGILRGRADGLAHRH
ncbi:MAG: sigma-54-dependent Fis family transcriptional regulator [Betaproteobacteria bacterium HGW-Betaproteobacteria-13]|uniref:Sigma-54-dependent Fis family transcriptional regulator n=2 Tax=Parazoarcus communis TaxID=41977 RepID=A0A2U8H1A0_9RHOO|nr:sigma-54-dependent Fis family transcriptional regulator [Parazoarcus communis]PKO79123.1 MAG: sigma-54-dependent Fis family transcriptional regulator [Betaproteobacteria bacterium HGW-Betaproteobacteria-13]